MKKVMYIVLILLILFTNISIVIAKPDTNKEAARPVTVAFPQQSNISEIGENGELSGYTYDYVNKIAEIANWDVEYVKYSGKDINAQLTKAFEDVQIGKVDFIGATLKNEFTEKLFKFPENNYGNVYTILMSLESNTKITDNNFMYEKPLRIAVWDIATTNNEATKLYCENNNIEYKFIKCKSAEEQRKLLESGKADVMVGVSLNVTPYTFVIAKYDPKPFYLATNSDGKNSEALKEVDAAITKLEKFDRYFQRNTFDKYFSNSKQTFYLSKSEKAFIKDKSF